MGFVFVCPVCSPTSISVFPSISRPKDIRNDEKSKKEKKIDEETFLLLSLHIETELPSVYYMLIKMSLSLLSECTKYVN